MNAKLQKGIHHPYFPFFILFLMMFLLHLRMNLREQDYLFFEAVLKDTSLRDYLNFRYHNWTSRLLIEAVMVELIALPEIVFKVLDTFIVTFTGVMLSKLFVRAHSRENNFLIVALMLMYEFILMSSAGWYATLMNYMWPLLCMLVAFMPVRNYLDEKREKWYLNLIYFLNLIFACNLEQAVCIIGAVYGLLFLDMIWKKKIQLLPILCLFVAAANILFILNCPGNAARTLAESQTFFPEFLQLNFLQKLLLGLSATLYGCIRGKNLLVLTLCFATNFVLLKKKLPLSVKILSCIPTGVFSILYACRVLAGKGLPFLPIDKWIYSEQNILTNTLQMNMTAVLSAGFCVVVFVGIAINLYFIFRDEPDMEHRLFVPVIFLIVTASRVLMGFSPTVFASELRTTLFLDYSVMICMVLLWHKIIQHSLLRNRSYILVSLLLIGLLQYANTLRIMT